MIPLLKIAEPDVLRRNAADWTQVLLDHRAAGTKPTDAQKGHYRHADIKAALIVETNGKCAYCESKVRHVTYGDVEHVVPKSAEPEKTFLWENLTLACDVCNTNKSSHFGNHTDLVDPYVLNPADHLDFFGAMVLSRPGSGPGLATESTLDLNRSALLERRSERLRSICKQLHLLVEVVDANKRAVIRRDLEREFEADKEYSAMARTYIVRQLDRLERMVAR